MQVDPNWFVLGIGVISALCTLLSVYLHLKIRSELADLIMEKLNGRYLKTELANEKFDSIKEDVKELKIQIGQLPCHDLHGCKQ